MKRNCKSTIYSLVYLLLFILIFLVSFENKIFAQYPGAGNCLDFDALREGGNPEYVSLTQTNNLPIYNSTSGAYTVEFWMRGHDLQSESIIFSETNFSVGAPIFKISNGVTTTPIDTRKNIAILIRDDAQTVHLNNEASTRTVFDGFWHHVAWVDDNGVTSLYIDGILDETPFSDYTRSALTLNRSSVAAVVRTGTLGGIRFPLWGAVDELRLWNTARTQDQIRDNMCRKLTGFEPNLVAYYRFDASSGTILSDLTGHNNTGTLVNMETNDWITSSASLGDVSTYVYTTSWSEETINLVHPNGDDFTISSITGTTSPEGAYVYYVNEPPNITTPPSGYTKIDPLRYWGVRVVRGTGISYTVEYNYEGHPGIGDETAQVALRLASRDSAAVISWNDTGTLPNTTNNTLTSTGRLSRRAEYILGTTSTDNSLPVELATLTAHLESNGILLEWKTYSEVNNEGFEVWRAIDTDQDFQLLASYETTPELQGAGNSNTTHQYLYLDQEVTAGHVYYYQLWDVSFDGSRQSHGPVSVSVNEPVVFNEDYLLFQNYPNPFNPFTNIRFQINNIVSGYGGKIPVQLYIFDPLGRRIKTLIDDNLTVGDYALSWDGTDNESRKVASGSYVYLLQVGDQRISRKLILIR